MSSVPDRHKEIRNRVLGLIALQLFLLAWIFAGRLRSTTSTDGGLHVLTLTVATLTLAIVLYAAVGRPQPSWHVLRRLWTGAAAVSLISLAVIDYGAVGRVGFSVPVVLVVAMLAAYRRGVRRGP